MSAPSLIKLPTLVGSRHPPQNSRNAQGFIVVHPQKATRASLDTLSGLSIYSVDDDIDVVPSKGWKNKCQQFWHRNKGVHLVIISQFFSALMITTTRVLETDDIYGAGMGPFEVLIARMSITSLLSSVYMWWVKVPHAPFGKKDVRWLLIARGITGFFGVYGMYYSLIYLPLSEATVISFLAPPVACWACSFLLKEPFTRMEQTAGLISLLGVLLIARPFQLSSDCPLLPNVDVVNTVIQTNNTTTTDTDDPKIVTHTQRLAAVSAGLIGVCGSAAAYAIIRHLGRRAHSLISVNYFAVSCTIVSTIALFLIPSVPFRLPSGTREWSMLLFAGICGFIMQVLITAGLQHEKSSRATNMVYTQMLFALAFDKIVWDTTPGVLSLVGSTLILGSAIYMASCSRSSRARTGTDEAKNGEEEGLVEGAKEAEEAEESGSRG